MSWSLGTRVFRDEGMLKAEPKGACFKDGRDVSAEKKSKETFTADEIWLKVQIAVAYWKVVGKPLFRSYR